MAARRRNCARPRWAVNATIPVALVARAIALGMVGLLSLTRIERIADAKSAVSAERQATLLERRESAIRPVIVAAILRAPRIFRGRASGWCEQQARRNRRYAEQAET